MGNPSFYYYPTTPGPLKVVDLGVTIADLFLTPNRARVDAFGGDMRVSSRLGPASARVTIRKERFTSRSVERELRNVEDHLIRGGRVGFSWDHAKTWAAYTSGPLVTGGTIAYTGGNAYTSWSASATLASGDEIAIESPNPEMIREINSVSSLNSSGDITLGAAATFTWSYRKLVRWRWFFPALYLPQDQLGRSIVTSDRGLNFNLDCELAVDMRVYSLGLDGEIDIDVGKFSGIGLGDSTAKLDSYTRTLDQALADAGRATVTGVSRYATKTRPSSNLSRGPI